MSKIAVVGTGYVGLVAGTMFSDCGHDVICCDIDDNKIDILNSGVSTIYEEGLEPLIAKNLAAGALRFTSDIPFAIRESDVIFIAVGTPPREDGHADLSFVHDVAHTIGKHMNAPKIVVDKSTVPVGTAKAVAKIISGELSARGETIGFEVVSNPEFLREGTSVADFRTPDRVVIGCRTDEAFSAMESIYRKLIGYDPPIRKVLPETAEMIKYASNAFLAVKISYINELSRLCEKVGADIDEVAHSMGLDARISPHFFQAGPGYGGSCFPKDTKAICNTAVEEGINLEIIEAAIRANDRQKLHMVEKITNAMGGVSGKTVCVLGVTFKPGTDDTRDAPSLVIISELAKKGAHVRIYDPQCKAEFCEYFGGGGVCVCGDEYEAASGADAAVLLTHWPEFSRTDMAKLKAGMAGEHFFDLRNMFSKEPFEAIGFKYHCVGKV